MDGAGSEGQGAHKVCEAGLSSRSHGGPCPLLLEVSRLVEEISPPRRARHLQGESAGWVVALPRGQDVYPVPDPEEGLDLVQAVDPGLAPD